MRSTREELKPQTPSLKPWACQDRARGSLAGAGLAEVARAWAGTANLQAPAVHARTMACIGQAPLHGLSLEVSGVRCFRCLSLSS